MAKKTDTLVKTETTASRWDVVRAWWKDSETILLSRLAVIGGIVTSVVGYMDWSPLWSFLSTGTEFNTKQVLGIGVSVIGAGITMEIARRHRATDL